MPVITSIKPQKSKKRVNIYLDGKYAFGLDLETHVKLGLKVEQELTEEEVGEVVKKAEFQKVYNNILRFASLRPRSKKEFERWLYRKKVLKVIHKELFDRLKRLELLDDEKFAFWWIEQRLQFKHKSAREIRYELISKGIDKVLINRLIDETVNQEEEEKNAKKLYEKNKYKWKKLSSLEARKKASAYLGRKGFNWEVIREVLEDNSSS